MKAMVTDAVPRFRVAIDEREIEIVAAQMRSGELAVGSRLELFEAALKDALAREHCAAVVNGCAAIQLAIEATGVHGGRVLLPAVSTCFAPLNAVRASGNQPVFADVDVDCAGLGVESSREILRKERVAAIVSPNHFGVSSDIPGLAGLGLPLIEDSSQSLLTNTLAPSVADMTVCSFYPSKWINAIDGGAVLTDHLPHDEFVRDRRYYDHQTCDDGVTRYNFRMADLHAAVGLFWLQQTAAMSKWSAEVADRYRKIVSGFDGVHVFGECDRSPTVYQKFVLRFSSEDRRGRFVKAMARLGVHCAAELVPLFRSSDGPGPFPRAESLIKTTVSVPFYPALTDSEVERVCHALAMALETALSGS